MKSGNVLKLIAISARNNKNGKEDAYTKEDANNKSKKRPNTRLKKHLKTHHRGVR